METAFCQHPPMEQGTVPWSLEGPRGSKATSGDAQRGLLRSSKETVICVWHRSRALPDPKDIDAYPDASLVLPAPPHPLRSLCDPNKGAGAPIQTKLEFPSSPVEYRLKMDLNPWDKVRTTCAHSTLSSQDLCGPRNRHLHHRALSVKSQKCRMIWN